VILVHPDTDFPRIGGFSQTTEDDIRFMRLALRLARHGYGGTSPNPMVGALLEKGGRIIGKGWHHRAGEPHAEIEALKDAQSNGAIITGSTMYVSLEPCCTQARTPPCTEAIKAAGIRRVVVGAIDPNPVHAGRAFPILQRAGISVSCGILGAEAAELNEAFNHWIVHRSPFVTLKAAMTLDGKIATASGKSKWITSEEARAYAMNLRCGVDAILVGINTVLADDPSLTIRLSKGRDRRSNRPQRIVLDAKARTPLSAKVITDAFAKQTTVVVGKEAPRGRVNALSKRVNVCIAPSRVGKINLTWLLQKLGAEEVTHLLVEGGGEVNASFLEGKHVHRVAFFYAPKIIGGASARKAVAGVGVRRVSEAVILHEVKWRRVGPDVLLTARIH